MAKEDRQRMEQTEIDVLLSHTKRPISVPDTESCGDLECAVRDIICEDGTIIRITAEVIVWPHVLDTQDEARERAFPHGTLLIVTNALFIDSSYVGRVLMVDGPSGFDDQVVVKIKDDKNPHGPYIYLRRGSISEMQSWTRWATMEDFPR